jgi:hypothetical protein
MQGNVRTQRTKAKSSPVFRNYNLMCVFLSRVLFSAEAFYVLKYVRPCYGPSHRVSQRMLMAIRTLVKIYSVPWYRIISGAHLRLKWFEHGSNITSFLQFSFENTKQRATHTEQDTTALPSPPPPCPLAVPRTQQAPVRPPASLRRGNPTHGPVPPAVGPPRTTR